MESLNTILKDKRKKKEIQHPYRTKILMQTDDDDDDRGKEPTQT